MGNEQPEPLTLRKIWGTILDRFLTEQEPAIPRWPPDVFALCAYALKQQSRYVRVVSTGFPPVKPGGSWQIDARNSAKGWLGAWQTGEPSLPAPVEHLWAALTKVLDEPLPNESSGVWSPDWPLLELLAIADEACSVLHSRQPGGDSLASWSQMLLKLDAQKFLKKNNRSSFCSEIAPSRLRVLLKDRVPQKGLTVRSLSLYAGLIEGNEISPRIEESKVRDDLTVNVLVIPWPFAVHPSQLKPVPNTGRAADCLPEEFGFFTVSPAAVPCGFSTSVLDLIKQAERDVGKVRLVVIPELALTEDVATALAASLKTHGINLVCGVGQTSTASQYGKNYVSYSLFANAPAIQHKHHRWKLDEPQIRQYSAGAQLHIGTQYWEHIDLSNRTLSFVELQNWLNTCVLICEDLSRPDPVGDIIRAVGPNLTIALLMDGPQLRERWPARHATILADDPGCSVLTVTSLGMSELSKPLTGEDRSRVIALWKESGSGSAQEIELPKGKNCVVLSLSMRDTKDWSADGRFRTSASPALTGVRFFEMRENMAADKALS
jgi:hypothetical protein